MQQMIFVSPEEAAAVFGMSAVTIRTWIAEGKLKTAPRVGRKHRIYVESVAEQAGLTVDHVRDVIAALRAQSDASQGTINKTGALLAA